MGLLIKPLPAYTGPYAVSTTDLELPVSQPRADFSPALLKATGEPALKLDTVLVTLFYPANPNKGGCGKRLNWVQRPVSQTANGYARFLGKNAFLVKALFWLVGARITLPVEGDKALAYKVDPEEKSEKTATRTSEETLVGEQLSKEDQFPLVIFSHGLSGTRTTYSQWCGEIASRGSIVACIEHRDGSGPISVVRLENGKERVVDYIRAEEHLQFPAPHRPQTSLEFRTAQLSFRLAEIDSVLSLLTRLNEGEGAAVAAENRRKDYGGEGVVGKWLVGWEGRINLNEVVMAGHSFGGAITIQALRAGLPQFPFVRGIALDPWADPIPPAPAPSSLSATPSRTSNPAPTAAPASSGEEKDKVPLDIKVPLLVINSESFTLWRVHYKLVRGIVEAVEGGKGWLMTLIGSIHTSFSDFPTLSPYLSRRSGSRVQPNLATHQIVEICFEFLSGQGTAGAVLGKEVEEGDDRGARPGEGEKEEGGKRRVMEGEVGGIRMHVRGQE
ncbi:hypothetical protein JCM11641_007550 [Rhodosporidiobolus odoratus]